jgi:predicted GH43/DUF377 family glycosyl hydrolase
LYLLPRLATVQNYSRIGLARVQFNRRGDPVGVECLGVILEPQAHYEQNTQTGGGVEDPRVTYIAARGLYVMTYTAYGPTGARLAAALSRDLVRWRRLGLVRFAPLFGLDVAALDNKDGALFPEPTPAPDGRLALALIHRPTFQPPARPVPEHRPSKWISYAPLDEITARRHVVFGQHHLLAAPQQGWEDVKVGAGAPPLRVGDGWLVFYHGVSGRLVRGAGHLCTRPGRCCSTPGSHGGFCIAASAAFSPPGCPPNTAGSRRASYSQRGGMCAPPPPSTCTMAWPIAASGSRVPACPISSRRLWGQAA